MLHPGAAAPDCAAPTPASPTTGSFATSRQLGITAIELMPVHHFVDDKHLLDRGLTQLLGLQLDRLLRAATRRYGRARTAGAQVNEFKTMVKSLHNAGIEVILDVVYNHTAEGNHLGPTLSFRGIDNAAYYRLVPGDRALLHGLHRHRQHPEHAAPAHDPADHGQPALLGAGDARRRLPLRPRVDAGPRAARGRPAVAPSSTSSTRTRSSPRSS